MLTQHIDNFRQAPVEHQRLTELTEHHVERLEVAMQHSLAVSEPDCLAHGDELSQQPRERQLPLAAVARQSVQCLDRLFHVAALQQLHGVKRSPVLLIPDVVNRHDAGMLKLPRDLGLFEKPLDDDFVFQSLGEQFLERNLTMNRRVFRAPDVPQSAVRKVIEQSIPVLRSWRAERSLGSRWLLRRVRCRLWPSRSGRTFGRCPAARHRTRTGGRLNLRKRRVRILSRCVDDRLHRRFWMIEIRQSAGQRRFCLLSAVRLNECGISTDRQIDDRGLEEFARLDQRVLGRCPGIRPLSDLGQRRIGEVIGTRALRHGHGCLLPAESTRGSRTDSATVHRS